jgi:hypothetical protein
MISAAAFAHASNHVPVESAPYAPATIGSSPSTGRQRRRRFRQAVISVRPIAAAGGAR